MAEVLVINTGSSSLKYQLIDAVSEQWQAKGLVERIGEHGSRLVHTIRDGRQVEVEGDLPDHATALELVLATFAEAGPDLSGLLAIGHRAVHGGDTYRDPVVIDDAMLDRMEELIPLAPLHNPACLLGMRELGRLMPAVPHVAVFDTAFHATMPPEAYTYAIPAQVARDYRIRKYGFHGTSFRYVTRKAAEFLRVPQDEVNLVICHLGNGASMAAVRGGRGVDTTMGLTPLPGLVMGTRSGDVDPAIVWHLVREAGMSLDDVDSMLNKSSGLKGLAGDQDMRAVHELADAGDEAAQLALAVYAYRIRLYVGAYFAAVPGVHALVFTAGIGEHDAGVRAAVCEPLGHLGIEVDDELNTAPSGGIRAIDAGVTPVRTLVIPTNEEAEIARQSALAVAVSG